MDLRGAVALVTGGNGGLGQRICHALAKEGVHIAVMYAQSHDQAHGVARELTSRYQINAAAFACDIIDGAAVKRVVGDVTGYFGRIDNIASVAGVAPTGSSIAYAVSKAGLIHLTRCMALALAPEILVN